MERLLVALLLLALAHQAQCDCKISRSMIEGTNRIFTYRDSSGDYQLQRTETVPSGVSLFMFCSESDIIETNCQENGQFSVSLPMSCGNPMSPQVTRVKDGSCKDTMYAVGYFQLGNHLELYRSCFDTRNVRVVFTESDVYFKSFFPQRPFTPFLTDDILTPAQEASFSKRSIYESFNCIFGDRQTYIPSHRDLVINRGHMVASADFLFLDQMASTFRYLNVVPQFKSINDGNWEKIERWVRSQIPNGSFFRVKTVGIKELKLRDGEYVKRAACLDGDNMPVPEWTFKVVKSANLEKLYVFLTYNNIFENERPDAPSFCRTVPCPINLPDTPNDGFTFCCDPED